MEGKIPIGLMCMMTFGSFFFLRFAFFRWCFAYGVVACLFLSRAFINSEKRPLAADDDDEEEAIESELSEAELGGMAYGRGGGVEEDKDARVKELECEALRIQDVDARERGVESIAFVGVDGPAMALVASELVLHCKEELESDVEEALAVGWW